MDVIQEVTHIYVLKHSMLALALTLLPMALRAGLLIHVWEALGVAISMFRVLVTFLCSWCRHSGTLE